MDYKSTDDYTTCPKTNYIRDGSGNFEKRVNFLARGLSNVIGEAALCTVIVCNVAYTAMTIILNENFSSNFVFQSLYEVRTKTVLKFSNMVARGESKEVT